MKATSSLPHFHTHLAGNAPTWSRDNPDAPGRIRTSDQQLRRLLLYPPELRARECAATTYDAVLHRASKQCHQQCQNLMLPCPEAQGCELLLQDLLVPVHAILHHLRAMPHVAQVPVYPLDQRFASMAKLTTHREEWTQAPHDPSSAAARSHTCAGRSWA